MRILLISLDISNQKLPNFGLYCIQTYIKSMFNNYVIDLIQLKNAVELSKFPLNKYHIVGFQICIWSESIIFDFLNKVRRELKKTIIVVGGPQICAHNKVLMELLNSGIINYAIEGQGEKLLSDIIYDASIDKKVINNIFFKPGKLLTSEYSINNFISPIRFNNEYFSVSKKSNRFQIVSSFGCSHKCTYCASNGRYTPLPLKSVIKDIDYLKNNISSKNTHIDILDGSFIVNKKRAEVILNKLNELDPSWSIHAEINVEHLNSFIIKKMANSNIKSIEVGLQTSNINTLQIINRKFFNSINFKHNIEELLFNKINVLIDLIAGLPNENINDLYNSIDYCYSLGKVDILISILRVYPKAPLFHTSSEYCFEINNEGFIMSSKTMSVNDIKTSRILNRLLQILWNGNRYKDRISSIINRRNNYSLSDFLKEALIVSQKNKIKTSNFCEEIIKKIEYQHKYIVMDTELKNDRSRVLLNK